jgi:alpha/beta superfamily hydrolase
MNWSALTEGKQKNELAQKEFRFIKTIITMRKVITVGPSPLYQRCSAAKNGTFQGGRCEQTDAVECLDWRKKMNQLAQSANRFIASYKE